MGMIENSHLTGAASQQEHHSSQENCGRCVGVAQELQLYFTIGIRVVCNSVPLSKSTSSNSEIQNKTKFEEENAIAFLSYMLCTFNELISEYH